VNKISKHISYKEATRSITAKRLGIDNTPDVEQIYNMQVLAENIFEPLRESIGKPICINSMFRSEKLNKAIGGSKTSQHCKGQAMDIDDKYGYATNADMFNFIKDNLDFDQMIWEFGDDENPDWVHVSYISKEENRNKILKAYKNKGRTAYKVI
tara:strand:+ start:441 stop:902 length:462 start_codon:yes stop_codon:yes gene_type:complete